MQLGLQSDPFLQLLVRLRQHSLGSFVPFPGIPGNSRGMICSYTVACLQTFWSDLHELDHLDSTPGQMWESSPLQGGPRS